MHWARIGLGVAILACNASVPSQRGFPGGAAPDAVVPFALDSGPDAAPSAVGASPAKSDADADAAADVPVPPDLLITLDRGGCEKRCAVYRLTVAARGDVTYEGRYYVRVGGIAHARIDAADVKSLWDAFQAIHFSDLDAEYGYTTTDGCRSVLSDAPVATLTLTFGGRSKSVIHHHRCIGEIPAQLTALEDRVDRAAHTVRWIR